VTNEVRRLALEIAHCPVIDAVLGCAPSPCGDVINFQTRPAAHRWVAEPWSGHVDEAPILFLSSNPSSGDPAEPVAPGDLIASSDDDTVFHTFEDAFDEGSWIGIVDGTRLRTADGKLGKSVPYWRSCKARASELMGRPARPGRDYALTEVVHCGSQHEIGVWHAAGQCVPRYLDRVLRLSPAKVVIVVGAIARAIVRTMVPALATGRSVVGPVQWAGRTRYVLFLPHPNGRGVPKGVAAYLGQSASEDLRAIHQILAIAP
jgi:hypothetical protein